MDYSKYAFKFKSSDVVGIWRFEQQEFWITDTHCMIYAPTLKKYNQFKNKWNSYNYTEDIPEINLDESKHYDGEKWIHSDINYNRFLDIDEEELKPLKITDLYYRNQVRLVIGLDYINGVDNDYLKDLDYDALYQLEKDQPIYAYEEKEKGDILRAVIMPYIPQTRRYNKMWNDLDRMGSIASEGD